MFLETDGKQGLHGGEQAAPVARSIIAAHLNVPDRVGYTRGGSRPD